MENILVKDLKLVKCADCSKSTSVLQLSKKISKNKSKQIIVLDKKKPFGIITLSDIVFKAVSKNKDLSKLKAEDICTKDIFYVDKSDPASKAYVYMATRNHFFCPVVNKDKFVGLLIFSEVLKHLQKIKKK
jgi:signal-transduction protein with cAMP-binding, CBS, and nucleotidyltransferase domain